MDTSKKRPVFELKGSVLTVLVLHIKETDTDSLYPQLGKKIGEARAFFNNAPLLIDLSAVDEAGQEALDFKTLTNFLRRLGVVPVGVRGYALGQGERVLQAGLGLLPAVKTEKTVTTVSDEEAVADKDVAAEPEAAAVVDKEPAARVDKEVATRVDKEVAEEVAVREERTAAAVVEEHVAADQQAPPLASPEQTTLPEALAPRPGRIPTRVVTHPVRSGQQVLAPEGDLVILSSVNAGGEVLAAGNIHVYGALRGRALAGIDGDVTARIFSLQCNPELVAVAGEYLVNESLNPAFVNRSVIISLKNDGLDFQAMG